MKTDNENIIALMHKLALAHKEVKELRDENLSLQEFIHSHIETDLCHLCHRSFALIDEAVSGICVHCRVTLIELLKLRDNLQMVIQDGLKCDMNPTRFQGHDVERLDAWWMNYLKSVDESLRKDFQRIYNMYKDTLFIDRPGLKDLKP